MISSTNEVKIIDFGLSKRTKHDTEKLKTIAGTPYYMAPEIFQGVYDSKVDIWALGVMLYVFMSGYLPFQGEKRDEVFHKIQHG